MWSTETFQVNITQALNECNMIQQATNPCSTATTAAVTSTTANSDSGNEETSAATAVTTAAATPCPEVCEQTQSTGECPAGKQIF